MLLHFATLFRRGADLIMAEANVMTGQTPNMTPEQVPPPSAAIRTHASACAIPPAAADDVTATTPCAAAPTPGPGAQVAAWLESNGVPEADAELLLANGITGVPSGYMAIWQ